MKNKIISQSFQAAFVNNKLKKTQTGLNQTKWPQTLQKQGS